MESALRPMTASQLLDRTFHIYRSNFILFLGIALIVPALRLVTTLLEFAWLGTPPVMEPGQLDPKVLQAFVAWVLINSAIGLVVFSVGNALASSATAYAVSLVHLGQTATIADSYRNVVPMLGRILWLIVRVFLVCMWPLVLSYALTLGAALLMTRFARGGPDNIGVVFLGLGIVLLGFVGVIGGTVWGIYQYCRYALAVPACTVERIPATQGMLRSKYLSKGSLGRIFGVFILTGLMAAILGTVIELPILVSHNIFTPEGQKSMTMATHIWLQLAQFAGTALAGPIATIAMALVYYDERVRKEAFDLQVMMQAIGPANPAPAPLN